MVYLARNRTEFGSKGPQACERSESFRKGLGPPPYSSTIANNCAGKDETEGRESAAIAWLLRQSERDATCRMGKREKEVKTEKEGAVKSEVKSESDGEASASFLPAAADGEASDKGQGKRQQVFRACPSCRASKARCTDSRPCPRCIRMNQSDTCSLDDAKQPRSKRRKQARAAGEFEDDRVKYDIHSPMPATVVLAKHLAASTALPPDQCSAYASLFPASVEWPITFMGSPVTPNANQHAFAGG